MAASLPRRPVWGYSPTKMASTLLSSGFYSISQAARLLGVSPSRLRKWITGRESVRVPPLIESDLPEIAHRHALSFLNLIEARFVHAFAEYGIHVRSIRAMAAEAKRFLGHAHPFATSIMFQTDGRKIFVKVAEELADPKLYDLKGKNWGFYRVLERELKDEIVYGPTGMASAWYPHKKSLPRVFVHPKVSFGQPSLDKSGVPTSALYEAYLAEGENLAAVARWFEVPVEHVREAIRFERQPAHN